MTALREINRIGVGGQIMNIFIKIKASGCFGGSDENQVELGFFTLSRIN